MSFFVSENEGQAYGLSENSSGHSGRWSHKEHELFLEGLALHGKDYALVSKIVGTRTLIQTRTHAQKYFEKIERNENFNSTFNFTKSLTRQDSFSEKHQHGANNFEMFSCVNQSAPDLKLRQSHSELSTHNGHRFTTGSFHCSSLSSNTSQSDNEMMNCENDGLMPMCEDDSNSIQLPPILLRLGIQLEVVPAQMNANAGAASSYSSSYSSSSSASSSMLSNGGFSSSFMSSSYPISNLLRQHQQQLQHQPEENCFHSVVSLPIQCQMSVNSKTPVEPIPRITPSLSHQSHTVCSSSTSGTTSTIPKNESFSSLFCLSENGMDILDDLDDDALFGDLDDDVLEALLVENPQTGNSCF